MKQLIVTSLLLSSHAFAAAPVQTWINPECATGNCEVKAMRLYIQKYNVVKDRWAGNSASVEFETTSMSHLKKYAFVQYIQGCMFETSNLGEMRFATREFFGKKGQKFLHKTFELDSASDKDPIYWSNPEAGFDELRGFEIPRNSYYVNANPAETEGYGTWAGKVSNLRANKLFVNDFPTPSAWEDRNGIVTARISSLKFKICLHKVSDVPATVEDPKTQIGEAVTCMDWSSNYQFNFSKKTFEEKPTLHSACR